MCMRVKTLPADRLCKTIGQFLRFLRSSLEKIRQRHVAMIKFRLTLQIAFLPLSRIWSHSSCLSRYRSTSYRKPSSVPENAKVTSILQGGGYTYHLRCDLPSLHHKSPLNHLTSALFSAKLCQELSQCPSHTPVQALAETCEMRCKICAPSQEESHRRNRIALDRAVHVDQW